MNLTPRRGSFSVLGSSSVEFLGRVAKLFVLNPFRVLAFVPRLFLLQRELLKELGSDYMAVSRIMGRIAKQTWLGFLRGIVPVLLLAGFFGYLVHMQSAHLFGLLRMAIDRYLMTTVLQDLLVLVIALLMAQRSGASIAARFVMMPARVYRNLKEPSPDFVYLFEDGALYRETQRQLVAAVLTGMAFYIILAYAVLAGYVYAQGVEVRFEVNEVLAYLRGRDMIAALVWNMVFAGLCAGISAFVSTALGVAAGEEFSSPRGGGEEIHTVVWETAVLSSVLNIALVAARHYFIHT